MSTSIENTIRGLVCVLAAIAIGWAAVGPAPTSAQEVYVEPGELSEDYQPPEGSELDRPLEITVAFDYLRVAREAGDIAIAYQVAASDWEAVVDENVQLWVSMYIPNETTPITFAYSYHLPLEGRTGVIEFPDWLSTLHADRVGLCLLGTRPYDNLGLGRGYACDQLMLAPVERGLEPSGEAVSFELTYYGGMPYYGYFPWRGPFL